MKRSAGVEQTRRRVDGRAKVEPCRTRARHAHGPEDDEPRRTLMRVQHGRSRPPSDRQSQAPDDKVLQTTASRWETAPSDGGPSSNDSKVLRPAASGTTRSVKASGAEGH